MVRPGMAMGELAPLAVMPAQSAVWLSSVPLPSATGAKRTNAEVFPAVAVMLVGARGSVVAMDGVTALEGADQALVPVLLVVLARQV